jgi:hypothetical protein
VDLQEIDYDVILPKVLLQKEGSHTSLPNFLVTLVRNLKAPEIFNLTLRNIVIKVKAYKSQNGLTQCYNCHIWMHCRQPPRCLGVGGGHHQCECPEKHNLRLFQPAAITTCKTRNRATQQVTQAAIMQNRNYNAEENCRRQQRGQQGGISSRNTQHPIDHSPLLFAAPICSISSNHHNNNSSRLQDKILIRTSVKDQVSQCSLEI